MRALLRLASVLAALPLGACTVTRVGAEDGPPRIESRGLIEGHAAIGIRDEDDFFRLRLLDGQSDGALAEVTLWKLLRLEVGALGAGIGIGPFDLALGVFFYEPEVPRMTSERARTVPPESVEDCPVCAEARAREED